MAPVNKTPAKGKTVSKTSSEKKNHVSLYLASMFIGGGFGFFLQKARVFDPAIIQGQLLLADFTMVQTFLAALGASKMAIGLAHLSPFAGPFLNCHHSYEGRSQGKVSVVLGSLILGTGMALSGACPGTFYVQFGSGVPGSSIVLGGALFGIALYSLLEKYVQHYLNPLFRNNRRLVGQNYPLVAITAGAFILAGSYAIKAFLPSSAVPMTDSLFFSPAWQAQTAGIMIGLWQMPSILFSGLPMGMSSALVSAMSPLLRWLGLIPKTAEANTFLPKSVYVLSVMAGAYLSASLSGTFASAAGIVTNSAQNSLPMTFSLFSNWPELQLFAGGVCLWLGARIAGGCTSGHGISGCSYMSINSFLAVPAMFAGGIAAAFLLSSF